MTIVINAIKSGSWTDPTVWSVGRVPTLGDEVHANGFNIQIATNIVATEITTAAKNGGGAGGEFQVAANNLVITADIIAGTTTCLNLSAVAPYSAKIIGNVFGSETALASLTCAIYAGAERLEIEGNVRGGRSSTGKISPAINCGALISCKISGSVSGGGYWLCSGISCPAYPTTIEIGGDVIGGVGGLVPAVDSRGYLVKINKLGGSIIMQPNGSFPLAGCIVFDPSVDIKMSVNTTSGRVKMGKAGKGVKLGGGALCRA